MKGDFDFQVIKKLFKSSHFDRFIVQCKDCGQLYIYEFVEEGKWGGGDVISTAFIPVEDIDNNEIRNTSSHELFAIKPSLQWDDNRIYWVR